VVGLASPNDEMFKPEATLKLMRERFWGARAMERRVIRCCADNPDCPIKAECLLEYDAFMESKDPPCKQDWPSYKRSIYRGKKNYKRLVDADIPPQVACRNMSDKRTREILERVCHF